MTATEVIRLVAPEFKEESEDTLNMWLELTKPYVSKKRFAEMYDQALAYLTAHKMKMSGLGDTSLYGNIADTMRVSSVSEGGISVSYNNPSAASSQDTDAELMLTSYGMQFLHIRRMKVIPILSSREGDSQDELSIRNQAYRHWRFIPR